MQDDERAAQLYTYGLYLDPQHTELLCARAAVLLTLHREAQALEDAKVALCLGSSKAVFTAVQALRELNRVEEAYALVSEQNGSELGELRRTLELELAAERSELPGEAAEREKIGKLLAWLQTAGAEFSHLSIRYCCTDNRTVQSVVYLPAYSQILYVPRTHLITLQMACAAPIGRVLAAASLRSPKHSLLAAFLLYEDSNQHSFWRPFLDLLPQRFDSYPTNYSEAELNLLQNSPFAALISEKIHSIETDYKFICGFEPDFERFSLSDFTRMRHILSSRTFAMTIDGEATDGLVPFADMLNHKRPQRTTWRYDSTANGFVVQTLEDIGRGEEVQVSYGRKSNYRFLLSYGFLVDQNDTREYPLDVTLDLHDPVDVAKRGLTPKQPLPYRLLLVPDLRERSTQEAFSVLRFLLCSDFSLLSRLSQETANFPFSIPPLSSTNEILVLQRLLSLVTTQLQGYPSTLTDLFLSHSENCRNIAVILKGDIEVLEWFKGLTEVALACFQTHSVPSESCYAAYLQEVVSPLL